MVGYDKEEDLWGQEPKSYPKFGKEDGSCCERENDYFALRRPDYENVPEASVMEKEVITKAADELVEMLGKAVDERGATLKDTKEIFDDNGRLSERITREAILPPKEPRREEPYQPSPLPPHPPVKSTGETIPSGKRWKRLLLLAIVIVIFYFLLRFLHF